MLWSYHDLGLVLDDGLDERVWSCHTTSRTSTGGWADELPNVPSSYHTTSFMVEIVIPLEIGIPPFRKTYNEDKNEKALQGKLDLIEGRRNESELRNAI